MSSFARYLLTLFAGRKSWHLLLFLFLIMQLIAGFWLLHQEKQAESAYVAQLHELLEASVRIVRYAVTSSQLDLDSLDKLSAGVRRYQRGLDTIRASILAKEPARAQSIDRLNAVWVPVRDAAQRLLGHTNDLAELRKAVEETDQRLPDVLSQYESVIGDLQATVNDASDLKLLRDQQLILHRVAANINTVTGGILGGVDVNARSAISGSIESDLFLLEKSLGFLTIGDGEASQQSDVLIGEVSLRIQIESMIEQLKELAGSVRTVIESAAVMREVNKYSQVLVEDGGALLNPIQVLAKNSTMRSGKKNIYTVWIAFAAISLVLWLIYVGFEHMLRARSIAAAAEKDKEHLQSMVDDVARQMASFSEGDHGVNVRSKTYSDQHLVVQANRMIEHVSAVDKQIQENYLPIIKRVAEADSEIASSIDRQTNDIARLSVELNNIVASKTSGSALLSNHMSKINGQLQQLSTQVGALKNHIIGRDEPEGDRVSAHEVRQLQSHITDRLGSLSDLSKRIHQDVIDASSLLATAMSGDRSMRRSIEQLQTLTGRYLGMVDDIEALLANMDTAVAALHTADTEKHDVKAKFDALDHAVSDALLEAENGSQELLAAVNNSDGKQAEQAERVALILDELQDGNQRMAVVATTSDIGTKELNKLASKHLKKVLSNENQSSNKEGPSS